MNTCRTCAHWTEPDDVGTYYADDMCKPVDPDTFEPMKRGFEVRICKHPAQTFAESPTESNGFGLTDASQYLALLAPWQDFGCVRHEAGKESGG